MRASKPDSYFPGLFVPFLLNKTGCPCTQPLRSITFSIGFFSFIHPHPMEWINFVIKQVFINFAAIKNSFI